MQASFLLPPANEHRGGGGQHLGSGVTVECVFTQCGVVADAEVLRSRILLK